MNQSSFPTSAPKILPHLLLPQDRCKPLRREPATRLMFSPMAWLKLMFFLHAGETEIGGFGISAEHDPLYIEDFVTVQQVVSGASVEFADAAVADHFDRSVDAGLKPDRFARIWCHTHPGQSPNPSSTDEQTFARVFGSCDWSLMFIIGRTGLTYARLAFSAGPGAHVLLPVTVDWATWPQQAMDAQLTQQVAQWAREHDTNIHPASFMGLENIDGFDRDFNGDFTGWWDFEEYEPRGSIDDPINVATADRESQGHFRAVETAVRS